MIKKPNKHKDNMKQFLTINASFLGKLNKDFKEMLKRYVQQKLTFKFFMQIADGWAEKMF